MRKTTIYHIIIFVLEVVTIVVLSSITVFAAVPKDFAVIKDLDTGAIQIYDVVRRSAATPYNATDSTITESYEVFIPVLSPYEMEPNDTTGGRQSSGGVTATVNVDYEVNSTGGEG